MKRKIVHTDGKYRIIHCYGMDCRDFYTVEEKLNDEQMWVRGPFDTKKDALIFIEQDRSGKIKRNMIEAKIPNHVNCRCVLVEAEQI